MSFGNNTIARSCIPAFLLGVLLATALLGSGACWAISSSLKATLVDRAGNHHEVEKLTYQDRLNIEYYVEGQRRLVPMLNIDRLRLEGDARDEEQTIVVTLRTGRSETGKILAGSNVSPHQDALGGGGGASRFTGVTPLGPFDILVRDVREIIMRHPKSLPPAKETVLKATVITLDGKLFEVTGLQYRGKLRMDYNIGNKRRFVSLEKVSRIDFTEEGTRQEMRPVIIIYRSGKTVQGTVEASTVRLSGEMDKSYFERVNAAFTGSTDRGAFSIGMHAIKQIRLKPAVEEEGAEGEHGGAEVDRDKSEN
jgi:hypothetical protein